MVDGILAVFWYLKEYLLCLIVNKSCKYKGLVLWKIFNLSMAIVLRDRPFNWKGGGYGFLFRSENVFKIFFSKKYVFVSIGYISIG
jgi:hypothetical protein